MSEIPFPSGVQDGDVFFHEDKVCLYHGDVDTWECRSRIGFDDPEQTTYTYTTDVYIPAGVKEQWQSEIDALSIGYTVPNLRTQSDLNQALIDFTLRPDVFGSGDVHATQDWVAANYAPMYHLHNYASTQYVDDAIAAIPDVTIPDNVVTDEKLETRLLLSLPTNVITQDELEPRIQTLNASYVNYVEQRISGIQAPDMSNYATSNDFTALTGTVTAAINQVAANVETKATKQDVQLAGAAVDAKFDMLRSAIAEATDFDTLKARLLAVLN